MEPLITFAVIGFVIFIIYKFITTLRYKADSDSFQQAGVKVVFSTGKVTINGRTYDAKDVTGIETKRNSNFSKAVHIKVDDFSKPVHKIIIPGNAEKFVQRFSTALRKAGGSDFY